MRLTGWQNKAAGALALLGVLGGSAVHAAPRQMPWETTPPPNVREDRLRLEVGVWQAKIDTQIRSDETAQQPGTLLDGESDVGLSDGSHMADVELVLLPGKRQLFRINGFTSHRNGTAVLNQNVDFDGNTYFVNSTVKSVFNLDMLGVGYAYRVIKHPRFEWDVGVDVQIAAVDANVFVVGQPRESDSGVAPIPLLDTEVRWEVWRQLEFMGRYRWLGGTYDNGDIKASIRDWRYGLGWQFNQHLNIGVYQRHFGISVDLASGSNPGALRLKYSGWELGLRASL